MLLIGKLSYAEALFLARQRERALLVFVLFLYVL